MYFNGPNNKNKPMLKITLSISAVRKYEQSLKHTGLQVHLSLGRKKELIYLLFLYQ